MARDARKNREEKNRVKEQAKPEKAKAGLGKRRAILVGGGEALPSKEKFLSYLQEGDFLLSADAGFDYLEQVGLAPDLVLGDFDSSQMLSQEKLQALEGQGKVLRFPVKKDKTDMELALDWCLDHGFSSALVFGALGSRLDHGLVNLAFLPRYANLGLFLKILTPNNEVSYLLPGSYQLTPASEKTYLSFLAHPKPVLLSLSGFAYDLDRHWLEPASSLAISNQLFQEDNQLVIEGEEGSGLYYFRSQDGPRA